MTEKKFKIKEITIGPATPNSNILHTHTCSACRRGLAGNAEAHTRIMGLEEALGMELAEPLLSQVANQLEKITQETYDEVIKAMATDPMSFLKALDLEEK